MPHDRWLSCITTASYNHAVVMSHDSWLACTTTATYTHCYLVVMSHDRWLAGITGLTRITVPVFRVATATVICPGGGYH